MNNVIPIYGYRAELSANREENEIKIKVYSSGWNKDLARLAQEIYSGSLINYYIVYELKNLYVPSEIWDIEYFVGKILNGKLGIELEEFKVNLVNRADLDRLARILLFKSHGTGFREIKEWNIELWDFRGVLLKVEERSLEDIKNIGISYLALWK